MREKKKRARPARLAPKPESALVVSGHKVAPFGLSSPIQKRNGAERREERQRALPQPRTICKPTP